MRVVLNNQEPDAEFFLHLGLDIAGFTSHRTTSHVTNLQHYRSEYGSSPKVHVAIFRDMKKLKEDSPPESTKGIHEDADPKHFLWACHWLKNYPKLVQMAAKYKQTEVTCSKWAWYYVEKLHEQFPLKIFWRWRVNPDNADEVFIASVDGVHCRIKEPGGFDSRYNSHKVGKACLNYEVACAIREPKIVHFCGPTFQQNDGTVSQRPDGIQSKVPAGKKIVTDKLYNGYGSCFVTPNPRDPKPLRKFKDRCRARQESVNMRLKRYEILAGVYRHKRAYHTVIFRAVCVIVQYEMELGEPIFDV